MRNLTLDGKIIIFKTAISKVVFQSFITTIRQHIVNELEKYRGNFCGKILLLLKSQKLTDQKILRQFASSIEVDPALFN